MQLYNSDLMVASLYCWEKRIFPLAFVEVEADEEGKIQSIACRDDEWTLDYEMPPLKIMQIRLAGLVAHRSRAWPPRRSRNRNRRNVLGARRVRRASRAWICSVAQTGRSRCDSFRVGRLHDPAVASAAGANDLKFSLPLNRDESASVHQSRGRSYTSYGRILFKASATTLFGRIHVDKQNSFISEKCDFAGLWELARVTKLPIQYAARTTTGTGISYMQMELAHRDGVLIPEQKAEPEDPKHPG